MIVVTSALSKKFLLVNSIISALALTLLFSTTFALTFFIIPISHLRIHFFQFGIFTTAFLFGPAIGALVGGLASSYTAFTFLHNPWVIGGNAILGFFSAYFYTKTHPVKAVLAASAIQLPYLIITDIFLAHLPLQLLTGLIPLLFFENLICALAASSLAPTIKNLLSSPSHR